jgi:two-component system sensor histidine kinase SenX3
VALDALGLTATPLVALGATGEVVIVVVAAAALVVVSAVLSARARARAAHAVQRRLEDLADRIDARPAVGSGLGGQLDRLESAIDASAFGAARRAEAVLIRALDAIPQGVVLFARDGSQMVQNRAAVAFLDVRQGGPELDQTMWGLLRPGFAGDQSSRTVDVEGPPRRTYLLTALPLRPNVDSPADGPVAPPTGGLAPLAGPQASVEGVAIVIDDISERSRVENLRRDFVANISHELKTPVGALGLLAETLLDETTASGTAAGLDATSTAVVQRLAGRVHHEALRIGRTIDDLLELSRIEGGEPSSKERIPVVQLLADAAGRVRPAADLREVAIEVSCRPPRFEVLGDRRQLVSALSNLLDNAIKYSDPGSAVQLEGSLGDRFVELSVVDHGVGIPQPHLDRVFERFYRVDEARSRDTGGTGLGLAIVRHVIHNHRGEVDVTSVEGKGSRFTLRLPRADAAPVDHTDAAALGDLDGLPSPRQESS